MPDANTFKSNRPSYTILLNGDRGAGKTLQAHSFPKCYTVSCDPAGLETLRIPANQTYLNNLVWIEDAHNESEEELKKFFKETRRKEEDLLKLMNTQPDQRAELPSIFDILAHAKLLARTDEAETLILDGFTFFCDMKWQQINEYEEVKSVNTGNVDTMAMYRNLGLWLQRFVASELLTMATRNKLNVICTVHLKRESDVQIQGAVDKKTNFKSAGKVNKSSDIAPLIEGGFRNKVEALFGASIYLDKSFNKKVYAATNKVEPVYTAICDVAPGLDTVVLGKNRYGLDPKLNLTGKSLYQILTESVGGNGNKK